MRVFNRGQRLTLVAALLLFLLIGIVPPWRYLDGTSAGFHPVFAPPEALPDSLAGEPAPEYTEIKLIPLAMYNMERKSRFSEEERLKPYLDVRRMMTLATFLFLGATGFLFYFNRSRYNKSEAELPATPEGGDTSSSI